jgi:hypothetical protein
VVTIASNGSIKGTHEVGFRAHLSEHLETVGTLLSGTGETPSTFEQAIGGFAGQSAIRAASFIDREQVATASHEGIERLQSTLVNSAWGLLLAGADRPLRAINPNIR